MNRRTTILIICLIVLVIGGALIFGLNQNKAASDACLGAKGTLYQVTIQNNQVSATTIQAHLCNQLTIINRDNVVREIAFGVHSHHDAYDGVTEKILTQNQSLTVTLNSLGSFRWHDHLHDEVQGTFTVNK